MILFLSLSPSLSADIYDDHFDKWHQVISTLLLSLPLPNRLALSLLFLLLYKIEEKSDVNRMSSQNLAIVFGPNLLRSASLDDVSAFEDSQKCNNCVCHMIQHAKTLFLDQPVKAE